jgi:insulysin
MQHDYPSEFILSGPSLIRSYDAKLIQDNLSWLRPDNFRIMLASHQAPNGVEFTEREQWYETEYCVHDFEPSFMEVSWSIYPYLGPCLFKLFGSSV